MKALSRLPCPVVSLLLLLICILQQWKADGGEAEWNRWVHRSSPHARAVWRWQFPAFVYKSCWYAMSKADVVCNFRSLL